jgi:hypothetical protein
MYTDLDKTGQILLFWVGIISCMYATSLSFDKHDKNMFFTLLDVRLVINLSTTLHLREQDWNTRFNSRK